MKTGRIYGGSRLIFLLFAVFLLFSACTNEEGEDGLVSITIGGNAGTAAPEWAWPYALDDFKHTIRAVDENGVEQYRAENLRYGDKSSFSLTPGFYTFYAEAFHNGDLKAAGRAERTIHSGQNPEIIIQMKALPDLDGTVTIVNDVGSAITEPVITGTKLIAVYSGSEQGVSFQWYKNGNVILGETHSEYTPTADGEYSVRVSLYGYNGKNSEPVTVDALYGDLSGDVIIEHGVIFIGMRLTAVYLGSEGDVSCQWHLNDFPIMDATGSTYITTEAGEYTVTVSLAGYNSVTSEPVTVILGTLNGNITIRPGGIVGIGTQLTANYSRNEPVGFQWNRNETAIPGANSQTYTPTETGEYTVTVSLAGYNSKTSEPVSVVYGTLNGNITIEPGGIVATGTQLTANYSGNEPVDFQWNRNETAIPGANSQTYTPTETGEYTVTVSLAGYNSKTSEPVIVDTILLNIAAIEAYLATQTDGAAEDNPVHMAINMELSSANWAAILNAIDNSGKYVNLYLSDCTRSDNTPNGGLSRDGTFNTIFNYVNGINRIVSLILPEAADSIAAGGFLRSTFYGFTNLRHVNTGNGITSIGNYAFDNNQLTSVIIGNSVTSIEYAAFNNNQLTGVTIGDNVTTIGDRAFNNNQLTGVTIGSNVTTIGDRAFNNNQLISVAIPNSVTSIGNSAFAYNQLTGVTIPDSVAAIGPDTFSHNQLTGVTIPNSVASIGNSAFAYNQLTGVTIGSNITTIGNDTFSHNQLTGVTIPDSVTSIGNGAFAYNQLTGVIIPNNVIDIGNNAFNNNELTGVTIGNKVTSIGNSAFNNNKLTGVTIPNSVTSIGEEAFYNNELTRVTFEGNGVSIDTRAFYGDLAGVYTSNGAGTYIYNAGTSSWKYNGLTSIGQIETYLENHSGGSSDNPVPLPVDMELSTTTWIAILNTIGNYNKYVALDLSACTGSGDTPNGGLSSNGTFEPRSTATNWTNTNWAYRIVSMTLPENALNIATTDWVSPFIDFGNLRHVDTGNGITSIGYAAFYGSYQQFASVTIGNSVTSIGEQAFMYNKLTGVTIPDSVITIGADAFSGNELTGVTIGNSVTSIGERAFFYNELTNVIIPDSVITIGGDAFAYNQLTSVTIGNSVTSIESYAFEGNQLTSVTIGANVTLGYRVFDNGFDSFYNSNGKQAGTYTYNSGTNSWTKN